MIVLDLYSRPECHLCERMAEELEPLLEGRARIRFVDITEDPALLLRYGERIPVLAAGGEEVSGYPLERERVVRYLAG